MCWFYKHQTQLMKTRARTTTTHHNLQQCLKAFSPIHEFDSCLIPRFITFYVILPPLNIMRRLSWLMCWNIQESSRGKLNRFFSKYLSNCYLNPIKSYPSWQSRFSKKLAINNFQSKKTINTQMNEKQSFMTLSYQFHYQD